MGGLNCSNFADKKASATLYKLNESKDSLEMMGEVPLRNEKN